MTDGDARFRTARHPAEGSPRVEFRVPEGWKEDVTSPVMGIFYREAEPGAGPSPAGGVLIVNLDTKATERPMTPDAADAQVRAKARDPGDVRRLDETRWLIRAKGYSEAKGSSGQSPHRSVRHVWVLVHLVRPDLLARAGFIFEGTDSLFDKLGDESYDIVEMLEREVEAATVVEA